MIQYSKWATQFIYYWLHKMYVVLSVSLELKKNREAIFWPRKRQHLFHSDKLENWKLEYVVEGRVTIRMYSPSL